MGISASQARLLTITARLTSNEYESQQISNAKMRLATQAQQVSSEYIAALNTKQFQFMTYDAQGSAITEALTANALYQYNDMKNQYLLINTSGQAIVAGVDAKNFEKAENLDEFLGLYGITKEYKTTSIAENVARLESDEIQQYYSDWEKMVNYTRLKHDYSGSYIDDEGNSVAYTNISSDRKYEIDKMVARREYNDALLQYQDAMLKHDAGVEINTGIYLDKLTTAKTKYTDCVTYDNWILSQATQQTFARNDDGSIATKEDGTPIINAIGENDKFSQEYLNVKKYYEILEEVLAEAEDLGCTSIEDTYKYSDTQKAQWYTNLWYRMNGESTDKTPQGEKEANYTVLDSRLAGSSIWIQDALLQGVISIEVASNVDTHNEIPDEKNPLKFNLKGISWTPTTHNACIDFTEKDDDKAIARAEAEYERKNNEISAMDKKYENKIKTLDTEHTSLQTEYESVQSAMNKNIERSYKTFNG